MVEALGLLAQDQGDGSAVGGIIALLFWLGLIIVIIAGMWRTFDKAGQPGWAAIVPIYNIYVLCKIGGRPGWWVILCFIPIVNIVIPAIISIDVAKAFGKGIGFGIGLWLLGIIFYPILGFGSAQYQGPAAA